MGDFDDDFIEALKVQSWSLYSVGMTFILLRMFSRIKRLGIKNLQLDDWLMCLVAGLYTALVVCLNVITDNGGSNLYPPEMTGTFSDSEIAARIYGSKIVVISEQAMLNVIYTMKVCMLIMYTRLTLGLKSQKMVRYLSMYVACGWCASEIAFFTACRPFEGYWGMPPPDPQCTTLEYYAIVQGCFNISSDLCMLCIPVPLMIKMNVPWKQKGVLVFIFSMGLFVVIAALLTKVFNLTNIWDPSYMLWYVREASVAVYVSNLPMIWPLVREYMPWLRSFTPGSTSRPGRKHYVSSKVGKSGAFPGTGSRTPHNGTKMDTLASRNVLRSKRRLSLDSIDGDGSSYDDLEMALKSNDGHNGLKGTSQAKVTVKNIGGESQEEILKPGATAWPSSRGLEGIQVERTVQVQEERIEPVGGATPWKRSSN